MKITPNLHNLILHAVLNAKTGFYLEYFFWGEALNNEYGLHGRARSKREDFAKRAWRDIIHIINEFLSRVLQMLPPKDFVNEFFLPPIHHGS